MVSAALVVAGLLGALLSLPLVGQDGVGQDGVGQDGVGQDGEAPRHFELSSSIRALAIDPTDPDRVYAGTIAWGLVVSDDGGASWSATPTQLAGARVQSIAIHPFDPKILWVGTRRRGLWISVDRGSSFARIEFLSTDGQFDDRDVRAVSIGKLSGAGASEGEPLALWVGTGDSGLLRSDDGLTWSHVETLEARRVEAVETDPAVGTLLVVADRKVYVSLDAGAQWREVLDPSIDGDFQQSLQEIEFRRGYGACGDVSYRLVRHPDLRNHVWLAACAGLFASRTGGRTWTHEPTPGSGPIWDLTVDPRDRTHLVLARSEGLLESVDGGASWTFIRRTEPNAPFGVVAFDSGGRLQAGGTGGEVLTRETSGEVTISHLRTMQATYRPPPPPPSRPPYDPSDLFARPTADPRIGPGVDVHVNEIVPRPDVPGFLYAATRRGVFVSEDEGVTWRASQLGMGEIEVTDLVVDTSGAWADGREVGSDRERIGLLAATRGGGVYRSTSSGNAWQPSSQGLVDGVVRVLLQAPEDPFEVWAGTADAGIFRSRDGGKSWAPIAEKGCGGDAELGECGIRALVFAGHRLTAATDSGGVFVSDDRGVHWSALPKVAREQLEDRQAVAEFRQLGIDIEKLHVHDLVGELSDPDRLLVATSFGVFHAEREGAAWSWGGLRVGVARLARHPVREEQVWAATTRGLWHSVDGGRRWRQIRVPDSLWTTASSERAQSLRQPPIVSVVVLDNGDVLAGTDRGEVLRASRRLDDWQITSIVPIRSEADLEGELAAAPPAAIATAPDDDPYRRKRSASLLATAVGIATDIDRDHRLDILLALEARRRNEVPPIPPSRLAGLSESLRAAIASRGAAGQTLYEAAQALDRLRERFVGSYGVTDLRFDPTGKLLGVRSVVDDGRRPLHELHLFDLDRRILLPRDVFRHLGPTSYWKVLHDLARKPASAHADWILEDAGPILQWSRPEVLVTRPSVHRVAIWQLTPRLSDWPSPSTRVESQTVGVPQEVVQASISEDGRWLGLVDVDGRGWVKDLAARRDLREVVFDPVHLGSDPRPRIDMVHVTAREVLVFGGSGIVAHRLGPDGPILDVPGAEGSSSRRLHGGDGGFERLVVDRLGRYVVAVGPTARFGARAVVFVGFARGVAGQAVVLDRMSGGGGWEVRRSAGGRWLAVEAREETLRNAKVYSVEGLDVVAGGQPPQPSLHFDLRDAEEVRFSAGEGHLALLQAEQAQVWDLRSAVPQRVESGAPNLESLAEVQGLLDPTELAHEHGLHKSGSASEWANYDRQNLWDSSPDGRWLASAGPGRYLRLFHFAQSELGDFAPYTGTTLLDLYRYRSAVSTHRTTADVWPEPLDLGKDVPMSTLWQRACELAGRNMTTDEWRHYFGDDSTPRPACVFEAPDPQ